MEPLALNVQQAERWISLNNNGNDRVLAFYGKTS